MSLLIKTIRSLTYQKSLYYTSINLLNTLGKCRISKVRNMHCSSNLCVKMYMEYENNYAYSILESKGYAIKLNTHIQETALTKEQFQELLKADWSKKSHTEIYEVFPKFGLYCSENGLCISNKIFDDYVDHLTDSLKFGTDKELKSIFYSLSKWPETASIRTRNFIEIWVALDDECLNRIIGWSHDEILSFLALFYMLNTTRNSDFSIKSLQKLASKAKQLTPGQLVQTLFYIGIWRKSPFDMHNLEIELNNHYSQFTVDDLAIMAMGFFKSRTPIRDMELVLKITNTVIENSKTIHEVSLAALLKLIRFSTRFNHDNRIYRLLDTLQHEVPRLSVMCNVHLALVGTSTLNLHEGCLTKIADAVNKCMSQTRIKDLERLVLSYGTFNLIPQTEKCFFTNVMDELRKPERIPEINKYGRSFACCVAYLGLLGIYPVDLINKALSQEFLEMTYGKQCFLYGREILALNNMAKIFCSDAKVKGLSDKEVKIMAKKFTDYVPSEDFVKQYNITEKMVLDIIKVLKESRGGDEYVVGEHILSHHQRGDLVICNDPSGSPVPVKDMFPSEYFGTLRRPPDNNVWISLVIAGKNAIIYDTDIATGHFKSKIKELEALGYHAALVPWSLYSKLETTQEKTDFLNDLVKKAVSKLK